MRPMYLPSLGGPFFEHGELGGESQRRGGLRSFVTQKFSGRSRLNTFSTILVCCRDGEAPANSRLCSPAPKYCAKTNSLSRQALACGQRHREKCRGRERPGMTDFLAGGLGQRVDRDYALWVDAGAGQTLDAGAKN